ncbi:MAG: ASPIC/UnbV domain-containing protein, partial [Phycisphaerae bacterium]
PIVMLSSTALASVLYTNDGLGVLSNVSAARGVEYNGYNGIGWGTVFGDLDHDMDLDLTFVTTYDPWGSLFENDGAGYFTDVTAGSNLYLQGRGLVLFDFDRDGDLDMLKGDLDGNPVLYENVTPGLATRHWLIVKLTGVESNLAGIGARIQVTAGAVTMTREILSTYSFLTGPPKYAHFGLGATATVDRIDIEWPSGAVQSLRDVSADRYLTVAERSCQGDANADNQVNLFDAAKFMASFGSCTGSPAYNADADVDADGCVDLSDHKVLVDALGRVCP